MNESNVTIRDIFNKLKNKNDFGDMGDRIYIDGENLVVMDTYFYGGDRALNALKADWTTGSYGKYFKETHGTTFKIVKFETKTNANTPKEKNLTKDGIVKIWLKID